MRTRSEKVALITGASIGIGKDLAELFAANGHDVVLVARNQANLEALAKHLQDAHGVIAHVVPLDLSIAGAADRLMEMVSQRNLPIEFLVNNAGFGTHGPFAKSELSDELEMIQVNIAALTHLTRLVLPAMLARRSGRIMNLASVAGFMPGPYMSVYYATKAYVRSFSEAIASEVAGSGVTVTSVCPGPTLTGFQKRAGVENSPLFNNNTMKSSDVARIGYDAMMHGRRSITTGFKNKMIGVASRLMPRAALAGIAKRLNAKR